MATVWRTPCAFARLFVGKPGQILNNATDLGSRLTPGSLSVTFYSRNYSTYRQSPFTSKIKEQYEYEIVKKPPEWVYVERLLPFNTIPQVTPKEKYPSGWIPPKEEAKDLPYFIARTKNSNLPIYLQITYRGNRKISLIKKIEGDIWLLNEEIKSFLKKKNNRDIITRVHEPARSIEVKGDYVIDLQNWAVSKGF